jgi:hypothetical protein
VRLALQRLVVLALALGVPAAAFAQPKPASPKRGKEFVAGVAWLGPMPMGTATADLTSPNGDPLTLFETENSNGPGFGLTAGFGFELTRSIWLEVLGGYGQATLRTQVTDDFENAEGDSLQSDVTRFSVEGAALFYFGAKGPSAWFVRGGGGWGREVDEGRALAEDAFVASGVIGWRRWWGRPRGTARSGFRVSGGLEARTGGLTLTDSAMRFGPTAAFHVFFGF